MCNNAFHLVMYCYFRIGKTARKLNLTQSLVIVSELHQIDLHLQLWWCNSVFTSILADLTVEVISKVWQH